MAELAAPCPRCGIRVDERVAIAHAYQCVTADHDKLVDEVKHYKALLYHAVVQIGGELRVKEGLLHFETHDLEIEEKTDPKSKEFVVQVIDWMEGDYP